MNRYLDIQVYHINCPNRMFEAAAPIFIDLTRPITSSTNEESRSTQDHQYKILKCSGCDKELSVHYQEDK